jgi:hypothetical protein
MEIGNIPFFCLCKLSKNKKAQSGNYRVISSLTIYIYDKNEALSAAFYQKPGAFYAIKTKTGGLPAIRYFAIT